MMDNKRGWIRIVEVVIALLLISGALFIVINKGYIGKKDISSQVYDVEVSILREIELDSSLRTSILSIVNLPTSEEDIDSAIISKINQRKPDYLECKIRVCEMNKVCALETYVEKDVYAQTVAITANLETYSPRQMKLFCWER